MLAVHQNLLQFCFTLVPSNAQIQMYSSSDTWPVFTQFIKYDTEFDLEPHGVGIGLDTLHQKASSQTVKAAQHRRAMQ